MSETLILPWVVGQISEVTSNFLRLLFLVAPLWSGHNFSALVETASYTQPRES